MCPQTRRKVLKVAKIKDANYGCKDEGIDDEVSHQSSVISQSVSQSDDVYDVACNVMSDVVCDDMSYVVCDVMSDVVFDGVLMLCI